MRQSADGRLQPAQAQGNANPFIDDPMLVIRIADF